jgi:hypothetical protein
MALAGSRYRRVARERRVLIMRIPSGTGACGGAGARVVLPCGRRLMSQPVRLRIPAKIARVEMLDRIVTHGGVAVDSCPLLSSLSAGIARSRCAYPPLPRPGVAPQAAGEVVEVVAAAGRPRDNVIETADASADPLPGKAHRSVRWVDLRWPATRSRGIGLVPRP